MLCWHKKQRITMGSKLGWGVILILKAEEEQNLFMWPPQEQKEVLDVSNCENILKELI